MHVMRRIQAVFYNKFIFHLFVNLNRTNEIHMLNKSFYLILHSVKRYNIQFLMTPASTSSNFLSQTNGHASSWKHFNNGTPHGITDILSRPLGLTRTNEIHMLNKSFYLILHSVKRYNIQFLI
jgi:hypothetical protein